MAKAAKKKAAKKVLKKKASKKKVSKKKAAKKSARKPAAKAAKKKAARGTAKKKQPVKKAAKKKAPARREAVRREPVMSHGVFCHVEIPASNTPAMKEFYSGVFGWAFQDFPMGETTYTVYQTREGAIGGGMTNPPAGAPRQVVNYILVEDIDPVVSLVEERGGKVVSPKTEIPGYGWMAHFTDPEGNLFGLWKPAQAR